MRTFTVTQLLGLRNAAARVSGPVYHTLKHFGLLKRVHRGVSAGLQSRLKRIEVVVTHRDDRVMRCAQRNVNINNLLHLRCCDAPLSQSPIILELILVL